MFYASEHISLSVLEMIFHNSLTDFALDLNLLHITITDSISIKSETDAEIVLIEVPMKIAGV